MLFSSFFQLKSVTNHEQKQLIFNAYSLPYIIYAIPFLLNCNKKSIQTLNLLVVYKKALKILFCLSPSYPSEQLFFATGIKSLQEITDQHVLIYGQQNI